MTAVSLAVSAIPEGLPAIVTIVLSLGVQRMVRKNAIIRRLPAVETLGSASVICSDKTGTLTQNRMTLVKAYTDGQTEEIGERNSAPVKKLLQYAALCSDASVRFETDGEKHIGDPTETAILVAAHKNGMEKDQLNEAHPRRAQIPFDSDRKLMSTVNEIDGKNIVIVKGAFDVLSSRCVSGDIDAARTAADSLSAQALRVLAVACKEIGEVPASPKPQELEQGLVFMGLVGMIDPPRPEAKEAVEICRSAGIKPVMITGDHVITASAIAKELGILLDGDDALTGAQLGELSERELLDRVETISVYARVSPEDKIRIVHAWQKKGRIVSMTGDGVNDAPALKAADIGCAMGITGTDDNIKKAVGFLLGTNIGEVLAVFFAMLFWHQSPLISIQLLWINLVTDSLPAIALGMEPLQDSVMQKPPKPKDEGIFAHGFGVQIILQGVMFGVLTLIGFYLGWKAAGDIRGGRTMAFTVLAFSQLLHAFNMRSERSLFKTGWFSNKYLNGAVLISLILVAAVVFIPPVAAVFGMMELSFQLYLTAFGMALLPIVALEISKAFRWIR